MRLRFFLQLAVQIKKDAQDFYLAMADGAVHRATQKFCYRVVKDMSEQMKNLESLLLQWGSLAVDKGFLDKSFRELRREGLFQNSPPADANENDVISYVIDQQDKIISFIVSVRRLLPDAWKQKQIDALLEIERDYQRGLVKSLGREKLESKKYILVLDDNPEILNLVAKVLSRKGYRVIAVSTHESALRHIAIDKPGLVLLDIMMPGSDGIQILQEIKEIDKTIPVVMLSGVWDENEFKRCRGLGAFEYITKPVDVKRLEKIANKVLSGH